MRRFYLVVVIMLMLGLPCRPIYAIGDVLVPTDNGSSSTVTNKLPSAAPSSGETVLPTMDDSSDAPPATSSNIATLGYTPIPSSVRPVAKPVEQKPPTQIVKMMAVDNINDIAGNTLPYSLSVSMKDYLWGPDDVALVNHSLSIPADQVSKYCRLSVFGTLISDTGGYIFDIGVSRSQAVLRYSGKPSGINVMARAMCDTVPLPPNSGTVLQIGDKYAVYITQTQCPPPEAGTRSLVFQYAGNGKARCVYQ